jgi:transcriptional regulator with XRE-family HTH domain
MKGEGLKEKLETKMEKSHPVDVFVGSKLRVRRIILGLSQSALAKKLKITFQQIQKYEKGQNRIGSSRLYEFSKVLGVDVNYFFKGFDEKTENGFAEAAATLLEDDGYLLNKDSIKMLKLLNKINSDKVRERIFAVVKAVVELDTDEYKKK